MDRERTKTLILSLLVVLSIMSLHKIWFDSPMQFQSEASSGREERAVVLDTRNQIVAPRKATIGFGGSVSNNSYTVINYQETKLVWEKSKLLLLDFFAKEPNIQSVSMDEYYESKQRKSIELEFGKGFPSVLLSSVFDTMDNKIIDEIRFIQKILIPANNTGSIYILSDDYNQKQNIFKVSLENYKNTLLEGHITEYQKQNKEFVSYYALFKFLENRTVMPAKYEKSIPQFFVENEIDIKDQKEVINRTKGFFNENFDFVKSIKETSGSITYIYGYGEKSVRINHKGYLSYNQEMINTSSTNVLEALNVALNFIENHDGMPEGAYLSKINDISSGSNRGYYFGFNYDIDGFPMANNIGPHQIEIEVFGNSIKSYKRFIRNKMNLNFPDQEEEIKVPHRVIEENIEMMFEYYKKDMINKNKLKDTNDKKLQEVESTIILENVNRVEMVYFDTVDDNRKQLVIPSWLIGVGDRLYYFNGNDGKFLYTTVEN